MRQIKFRGFCKMSGWLYGDLLHLEQDFVKYQAIIDWSHRLVNVRVEENSVGQYTGLKDKNGKEIFESDIVRTYRRIGRGYKENKIEAVHFSIITARWYPMDIVNETHCEILGNIHENPNLLQ